MKHPILALALASLAPLGCGDDHSHATPPAGSPCSDSQQVSLPDCEAAGGDGFTDEACIPLDDAIRQSRAMVSSTRAVNVTAPTEMQAVPAATPFNFTWTAPTAMLPPRRPMTVGDELRRWTTFIPEAEAHCAAFMGRAYELRFKVGDTVVFRRQQSAVTFTPTTAQWTYLTNAIGTQTAELTVYTVQFVNNAISANTGPFYPTAPRRFTLMR